MWICKKASLPLWLCFLPAYLKKSYKVNIPILSVLLLSLNFRSTFVCMVLSTYPPCFCLSSLLCLFLCQNNKSCRVVKRGRKLSTQRQNRKPGDRKGKGQMVCHPVLCLRAVLLRAHDDKASVAAAGCGEKLTSFFSPGMCRADGALEHLLNP